jgi:hypothetical protein
MTRAAISTVVLICAALILSAALFLSAAPFPSARANEALGSGRIETARAPQTNDAPDAGKIDTVRAPAVLIRDKKVSDVKAGDVLKINDIVQTGERGRLRITLKDGSTLSLSQGSELRVVTHNPASQTTLIEMLHGRVRAHVASITNGSGGFEIRTPTARVRAVGTVVEVETQNTNVATVFNQHTIENLPMNTRDYTSLVQLVPGAQTGSSGQPSLRDYIDGRSTGVTAEDHFATVRNFDLQIIGETDLLPGEFTIIHKDQPPQRATPMYQNGTDYSQEYRDFLLKFNSDNSRQGNERSSTIPQITPPNRNPDCIRGAVINGVFVPMSASGSPGTGTLVPQFHYEATGTTGVSTGNALQIHFFNDSPCSLKFVVTNGAILRPAGFTERVIVGLLIGTQPLTDYQRMYTLGGKVFLKPGIMLHGGNVSGAGGGTLLPVSARATVETPPGADASMMLRSYCVQLHKLAPHPKTVYKFADAGDQKKYALNRELVDRAFHMVLTREITLPSGQSMDDLVQWLLWKSIEGLSEKAFKDEVLRLIKINYENQKKKWDKNTEHEAERVAQNLWDNVQKVINAKG